jgi:hypothetical protein
MQAVTLSPSQAYVSPGAQGPVAQLEPVSLAKHVPPNTQHAMVLGPFGVATSLRVAPSQVGTLGAGLGPAVKHPSISAQDAPAGAS